MKQINEQIDIECKYYNDYEKGAFDYGFRKGVEFANKWVLATEKPPEIDIFLCKTHSEIEDDTLYFTAIYDPKTDRWYGELNKLFKEHECNVTHYRPIELL